MTSAPLDSESSCIEPPRTLLYRHRVSLRVALGEIWSKRELLRTLAERGYRSRYKQALLGSAWAVITPVSLMIVFTLFFKRVADVDTGGAPYAVYSYLGLLPWTFFSASVSQGGDSLIRNQSLLNKVYCPREVFPISSVIVAAVDGLIAAGVLGLLLILTTTAPSVTSLWIPILVVVQVTFTLAVVLFASIIVVYLRDLRLALPMILQVGLFATPVAYGIEAIPATLRAVYVGVNPLAAVIDGYRRTVLYGLPPRWSLILIAAVASSMYLLIAYSLFKRLEIGIADVA